MRENKENKEKYEFDLVKKKFISQFQGRLHSKRRVRVSAISYCVPIIYTIYKRKKKF